MATLSKVREELAQTFLAALSQGQLPWRKCWAQALPVNAITGKTYRGINTLMLSWYGDRRGYTDTRWCTYNQAQEKGWQVRKGARGVKVEYWACYDTKEKKLLSWDDVRQKLKADPDYEKYLQLRCRTYTVFNAEQIDGIPEAEQRPRTDIGTLREKRDTLIRNMGIDYEEHGVRAYYSPGRDMVTLPPEATFDDTYSYMATLLHECGHATGHPSRLNRDMTGGFGTESYAREELRAEIASAFTAQALGLQLTDEQLQYQTVQHTAYIQNWAGILKDAPDELFRAIKDAEAISDYLIEKGEFSAENTLQIDELKEWYLVYKSPDWEDGELEIIPAEELGDREVIETFHCANQQEATEKLARYEELQRYFWDETNNPETQKWREELTADEAAMVERWDAQTAQGFSQLAQDILERSAPQEQITVDIDSTGGEAEKELTAEYALEEIHPGSHDLRLRFHGHGKVQGYSSPEARPWQAQIHRIREVVVEDSIHEVSDKVLGNMPALERLSWPHSTQGIDRQLLVTCPSLREIAFTGAPPAPAPVCTSAKLAALAKGYPGFNAGQLDEIGAGLRDGLTEEQIAVIAKPEFDVLQMNALRCCISDGLSPEQIAVIAKPEFGAVQMDILRAGFERGMSIDQVKSFAQPGLTPNQMLDRYWAFQNTPVPEHHLTKGQEMAELELSPDWD